MPVFNAERFLSQSIDSILKQSCDNFELIAVDDGSNDESPAILRDYARRDSRVVVISRPNTGIVGAMNEGLARARGEFIARMDGDDISFPGRFERQVNFLNDHPDHVAVGCQVLLMDEQNNLICVKKDTAFTHEEIDAAHLNFGWPMMHGASMMRRAAMEAIGGYRAKYQYLEDLDMFLRLAEIGKLANLPDILFLYRQSFSSICFNRFAEQSVIRKSLYEETFRRRGISVAASGITEEGLAAHARAAENLRTPKDVHMLWGWWALSSGFIHTARKHAMMRLRLAPLSLASWRLTYCSLRGR